PVEKEPEKPRCLACDSPNAAPSPCASCKAVFYFCSSCADSNNNCYSCDDGILLHPVTKAAVEATAKETTASFSNQSSLEEKCGADEQLPPVSVIVVIGEHQDVVSVGHNKRE